MFLAFLALGGANPPSSAPDEDEVQRLLRAARVGDEWAARRLYELFVARVFRAVRPLGDSEAEAEDIVQETFVKAFVALDRYEPREGARFVSWLLAIAKNTALKAVRRGNRARPTTAAALDEVRDRAGTAASAAAITPAERLELRDVLLRALGELPERERTIVCLRYGADLEVAEVARICDVSETNVRKICERERRRLRERIAALMSDTSTSDGTAADASTAPTESEQ